MELLKDEFDYKLRWPNGDQLTVRPDGIDGVLVRVRNADGLPEREAAVELYNDYPVSKFWKRLRKVNDAMRQDISEFYQAGPHFRKPKLPERPYLEAKMCKGSGFMGIEILVNGVIRVTLRRGVGTPPSFADKRTFEIPVPENFAHCRTYFWFGHIYIGLKRDLQRSPYLFA